MTPADTLRAAVDRLRELADAAPEPPWTEDGVGDIGFGVAMGGGRGVDTGDDGPDGRAVAQYIAAMHPGVGNALAAWLEAAARYYEAGVTAAADVFRDDPAGRDRFLTTGPGAPSPHAIAVARQILGSTA
ncbi:hypothetical protein [Streptomyces albidoflavus]|uniref:hypothetical protein n=1 Tax=Streptomyces albidoflavus TaxID=1886 RepID=UPI00344CB276